MSSGAMRGQAGAEAIGVTLLQRRAGRPTASEAEARRTIRQYIEDYARELGDQAPKSSVTRAINLMQEAGVSLSYFIGCLQTAKKKTQQHTASIQKNAGEAAAFGRKNKMPYFFSCLEDDLGLRAPAARRAAE